ncbi:MAG: TIGR00730 family Rossman fold protein, partial [Polyangiales bacterium]
AKAAVVLAGALVDREIQLVYGGAKVGLMGVIADAVLDAGGQAIGVIPELLMKKELVHESLTTLHVVSSMHERKAKMAALSDGFISLPGGLGTWEETFEMLTWTQLGIHDKPCALLDVDGYYQPIVELFARARNAAFFHRDPNDLLLVDTNPTTLLTRMTHYTPPQRPQWLHPSQS